VQRQSPDHPVKASSGAVQDCKSAVALARSEPDGSRAEAEIRALLTAHPDEPWPVLALLELMLQQGRGAEAKGLLETALSGLRSAHAGYPDRRETAGRARSDEDSPPWVERLVRQLSELDITLFNIKIYHSKELHRTLLGQDRFKNSKRLPPHGYKVFSKHDDDGIINEIFARIGTTNKFFVEFGSEAYENNTNALILQDWSGLWIEGNPDNVVFMREKMQFLVEQGRLTILHSFITRENINDVLTKGAPPEEPDFCSIDIDGNDVHVLEAINCIRPRVICIEYNAKFRPPLRYKMKYDAAHADITTDRLGASLVSITEVAERKGYRLIGCNIAGVNAFFVREDLIGEHFEAPYTAANHFEPANHDLFLGMGIRLKPSFGPYEQ